MTMVQQTRPPPTPYRVIRMISQNVHHTDADKHQTCQWRAVNQVKAVVINCFDADPKTPTYQQLPSCSTELCQLGLNVTVSDVRQERISSLTSCLSFSLIQPRAVGPETNVDVIITLAEVTNNLSCQNYCYAACKQVFPLSVFKISFTFRQLV